MAVPQGHNAREELQHIRSRTAVGGGVVDRALGGIVPGIRVFETMGRLSVHGEFPVVAATVHLPAKGVHAFRGNVGIGGTVTHQNGRVRILRGFRMWCSRLP